MATVTFIPYKRQAACVLGNVSAYVKQEHKTMREDGAQLVSGQNCSSQFSVQEFLATRQLHRKDSPIYFYHYVQSFHPDEPVTGELAHRIAKEFAEKAWPESEVLFATHTDAGHIHTHFVVNSVCTDTGKMLRQGPSTLRKLRPISDELCLKYGLSVLPNRQKKQTKGMNGREYRSAVKGESWKLRLAYTIDECMRFSKTKEEFVALMQSEGYQIRWQDSRKSITYTCPNGRKCRDDNLHESRYLKGAMELEFRIRTKIILGGTEAAEPGTGNFTSADYAGNTARTTAGHSGVERTAEYAVRDGELYAGTDGSSQGDTAANGRVPEAGGFETTDAGCGGDAGEPATDETTGWEKERKVCFSAQPAPPAADLYPSGAPAPADCGSVLGAVAQLGRALEQPAGDVPVMDSTTMRPHTDSKALRETRKKKIALGHKEDDHADEQNFEMTM